MRGMAFNALSRLSRPADDLGTVIRKQLRVAGDNSLGGCQVARRLHSTALSISNHNRRYECLT